MDIPKYKYDVFLSYTRRDNSCHWVRSHLYRWLVAADKKVCIDVANFRQSLNPDTYFQPIQEHLQESNYILLICTKEYFSGNGYAALESALSVAYENRRDHIIALILEEGVKLPSWLQHRQRDIVIHDLSKNPQQVESLLRNYFSIDPKAKLASDFFRDYQQVMESLYLGQATPGKVLLEKAQAYSRLFKHLINPSENTDDVMKIKMQGTKNIFSELTHDILSGKSTFALRVIGPTGVGKKRFVELLYHHVKKALLQKGSQDISLFINAKYYDELIGIANAKDKAFTQYKVDLAHIIEYLTEQNVNIYLFISGFDETARNYHWIEEQIYKYILEMVPNRCKVVSITRNTKVDENRRDQDRKIRISSRPKLTIHLTPFATIDHNLDDFVSIFCEINNKTSTSAKVVKILEAIKKCSIPEVDLFTLDLIYRNLQNNAEDSLNSLLNLSYLALSECITPEQEIIAFREQYSNIVYRTLFLKEDVSRGDHNSWRAANKHDLIRNYLISYQILQFYLEKQSDLAFYERVYPSSINHILKELINSKFDYAQKTVETIQMIIDEVGDVGKSHMCYILGRINQEGLHETCKTILKKVKNDLQKNGTKSNESKLAFRSVALSLVSLGEKSESDQYIDAVLQDKEQDDINRGFHMEYYGDLSYDPLHRKSLTLADKIEKDFKKTYHILAKKIEENVTSHKENKLFEIEVYTLTSLAQHRYQKQKLTNERRKAIKALITKAIQTDNINYPPLRRYLDMMISIFERSGGHFSIGDIARQIISLKSEKRIGWVNRDIKDGESVADHIANCLLIARIYLPNSASQLPDKKTEGYSKQKIYEILLDHDLGESIVGDIASHKKTAADHYAELKAIEYYSMVGTFDGIPNLSQIYRNFEEFEKKFDINSCIAHDIDIIEVMLQLYTYKSRLSASGFETFINSLERIELETEIGKHIEENIKSSFATRPDAIWKPVLDIQEGIQNA